MSVDSFIFDRVNKSGVVDYMMHSGDEKGGFKIWTTQLFTNLVEDMDVSPWDNSLYEFSRGNHYLYVRHSGDSPKNFDELKKFADELLSSLCGMAGGLIE